MRRLRGEEGSVATSSALFMGGLLFVIFLVVQFGMWMWGRLVIEQAAQQGVRYAVHAGELVNGADAASREQDALSEIGAFLSQHNGWRAPGSDLGDTADLSSFVRVDANPARQDVTVTITADPVVIFAFVPDGWFRIRSVATANTERFIPADER